MSPRATQHCVADNKWPASYGLRGPVLYPYFDEIRNWNREYTVRRVQI